MKKLITLTLTAFVSIGSINIAASAGSLPTLHKNLVLYFPNSICSTSNNTSKKKRNLASKNQLIAEINAIEDQMKTTTYVLSDILNHKSKQLGDELKKEGLTKAEKQALKDKFSADNKELYATLEEMQKPYMQQIIEKEKALNNIVHSV